MCTPSSHLLRLICLSLWTVTASALFHPHFFKIDYLRSRKIQNQPSDLTGRVTRTRNPMQCSKRIIFRVRTRKFCDVLVGCEFRGLGPQPVAFTHVRPDVTMQSCARSWCVGILFISKENLTTFGYIVGVSFQLKCKLISENLEFLSRLQ
jgi:hypothetical protein